MYLNYRDAISNPNTSIFYKDYTINIFCDASTKFIREDNIAICSGFIAVSGGNILTEYYHTINNRTPSFGELDALRLSISYAISASKQFKRVNIFSDYQSGVFGIRDWINRWRMLNGNIVGSKKILNHQMYIEMAIILTESGANNITLYHQKGHVTSSNKSIRSAQKTFIQSNEVPDTWSDFYFIKYISKWNNYIDKATKKILDNTDYNGIDFIEPLEFNSNNFNEIQRKLSPVLDKIKQNMYLV